MTSLLSQIDFRAAARAVPASSTDPRHRRPLVVLATLGGVVAAGSVLLVCLAIGVAGWFVSDAGTHGQPRDALEVGALGWLMAHGSGISVDGVAVTAVPLLLTLLCAWSVWRVALRVGDSISGHGPDADAIADGARDWTVPTALGCFLLGYAVVALLTLTMAGSPQTAPSTGSTLMWSVALTILVGGPALAIGSGRASIWATFLPGSVRATLATGIAVVRLHLLVAAVVLLVALVADFDTAANVLSQLPLDPGEATLFVLVSVLVLPNAVLFSGSYLLGPGFAVGTGTVVSPTVVALGPLPMFPLLAALPDGGGTSAWTPYLMAVPLVVAAVAAARAQRRHPTLRWEEGALRACSGGVIAGAVIGILATVAGGAVGPGRMQVVEPFASDVMVHAITTFGIGALVGGLAMTWWQRRTARRAATASA
ncbi:MAG TPA: DUF6350 family protein [Nocardioides sp.]|nr:DUF6350 family protein [Nocardioides sp.]